MCREMVVSRSQKAVGRWRVFILACVAAASAVSGFAAGYDPRVITFGNEREQIKSLPIEKRPNRPLHVYGNTVRRRHGREMPLSASRNR